MDNTTIVIIVAVVIVIIVLIVLGVLLVVMHNQKTDNNEVLDEELIEDVDEMTNVVDFPMFTELGASTTKFSLYCVPEIQPPLTREAKKYGGAHCTLFPSQYMPSNYSIVEVMKNFRMSNTPWNLMLPGITTKIKEAKSKNLLIMMIYGAQTITTLKNFLQTATGGSWKNPWGSFHLTLGNLE